MTDFLSLWLSKHIVDIIEKLWYVTPSPIQEKTIPVLLNEKIDIIWQAQTWTWKTASFWLPIIQTLSNNKSKENHVKALILTPTRELTIQVAKEIQNLKWDLNLNVFPIYGWQSYIVEKKNIKAWIDILVWTPWRIMDHMNNWLLDFSKIQYFVLDEADEMLNMWFLEDIEAILLKCNPNKITFFFSATMPKRIMDIAKRFMKDYKVISIKSDQLTTNLAKQYYYMISVRDKVELLCRIIDMEPDFYGLCFCRTKSDVDNLLKILSYRGYNVDAIHWDISQKQRENTLSKFRRWNTKILLATDVAARWIDIKDLSYVINYSIPQTAEDYTHRIWRTWRAGKSGVAITFVTPSESRKIRDIQYFIKTKIEKKDLPDTKEIIAKRHEIFRNQIWDIIDKAIFSDYLWYSKELLKIDSPEIVVSALLKKFLWDKFLESEYKKISSVSERKEYSDRSNENGRFKERVGFRDKYRGVWKEGGNRRFDDKDDFWGEKPYFRDPDSVRLFISWWRKDWMNRKSMVDYVVENSWINSRFIDDMDVMNEFSFFNTPKKYAKLILDKFKDKRWKLKFNIELSKEKR